MMDVFLDFVFPRRSLMGHRGTFMTREEFSKIAPFPVRLESSVLKTMGLQYLDRVVAAGSYAESPLLRRAIYTWKYGRIPGVGEKLGELMVRVFPLLGENSKFEARNSKPIRQAQDRQIQNYQIQNPKVIFCPVPLHWSREFYRGFNQAEQLANIISDSLHIPMVRCIRRTRATAFQARASRTERRHAMHGVFRCVTNPAPSHIILVDDILTTGATMEACAKVLKEQGATWVGGLVLAKG